MALKSWLVLSISMAFLACEQMSTAAAGYDVNNLLRLGYTQLSAGNPSQAIQTLTQALQYDPANIEGRRYLAYALLKAGRQQEAVPQFEYVLKAQPNSALDQTSLGDAYFYTNDYKHAVGCYQTAIKIDAHFAQAYKGLAHTYAAANENKLAIETCLKGRQSLGACEVTADLEDLYGKLTTQVEPSKLQE